MLLSTSLSRSCFRSLSRNVAIIGKNWYTTGEVCTTLKDKPCLDPTSWIAPSADVIGKVKLGESSSVFYHCTLRADLNHITIGKRTNIQDNAIIHVGSNEGTTVGNGVTVGHGAILHGCTVGDNVLIGMGAIIMNRSVIGADSIVAAGALIAKEKVFPPRSLIVGSPASVIRRITEPEVIWLRAQAEKYVHVAKSHAELLANNAKC